MKFKYMWRELKKELNISNNDLKRKHMPIRNRFWKKEKMRAIYRYIEHDSKIFRDNSFWEGYSYGFYKR